ncbi:histidine kinase [Corallococcus praedator]|uniref:Histidine kinase n=1 Tax=Corallococcus praedator TaxID=2316724 RepID=A0ABX9QPF8_9BACT|nr:MULTISPECIES: histidine kinase [Corallococcus]RKH14988.1 histidine kinase [Corallococcus sp. CA047B]RKH33399.1 histidine kinase [Corallococcus sp. CA031C]RKI14523.1 histidine kinase [Corallococcus praedator]
MDASPSLARRLPRLMLMWALPGVITSIHVYFSSQARDPNYPLSRALLMQLPPWQYWAFATPIILALGRRYRLERDGWPRSLAVHLTAHAALLVPHVILVYFVSRAAKEPWFLQNSLGQVLPLLVFKYFVTDLLVYGGILAVGHAIEYHRRYREGELAQAQLETRLAHARLDALRAQLHPHFLFNTLNAISVLVRKQDTVGSIRMLTGVSELLRMALNTSGRQHVPLHEDLDFLERYLDIEQTRFPDRLQVVRAIDPATLGALVPHLILQPLVENALKHGLATRSGAGRVELRASRDGARLLLEVLDDGPGLSPGWDTRDGCIGVANVRARLHQLYGDRHAFTLENRAGGGVHARLELPFESASLEKAAS